MGLVDFEAEVTKVTDYPEGDAVTRIIRLKVPTTVPFTFETGQWAFLYHDSVKKTDDPTKPKMGAFSIASSPLDLKEGNLDFCIKTGTPTGVAHFITKVIKVGEKIKVKAPFGHYFIKPEYDHYFFVATGTGIAPYISMIRTLLWSGSQKKITLIFGFRTHDTYLYREELESLAHKYKNFELIPTISRSDPQWKGHTGYVQTVIASYPLDLAKEKCAVYVCGAQLAIDGAKAAALARGIAEKDILIEKWH